MCKTITRQLLALGMHRHCWLSASPVTINSAWYSLNEWLIGWCSRATRCSCGTLLEEVNNGINEFDVFVYFQKRQREAEEAERERRRLAEETDRLRAEEQRLRHEAELARNKVTINTCSFHSCLLTNKILISHYICRVDIRQFMCDNTIYYF